MPLSPDGPVPTPGAPAPTKPEIRPFGTGSSLGGGGVASPGSHPVPAAPAKEPVNKITQFEQHFGAKRHEDNWKRSPNVTGTGAIHVRRFHCKLVGESLEFLDHQINEWLDAHPQYEVKFVTTSVGEWTGKVREPNLVVQVWV